MPASIRHPGLLRAHRRRTSTDRALAGFSGVPCRIVADFVHAVERPADVGPWRPARSDRQPGGGP